MKWFSKPAIQDERILHLKHKMYSEAFTLIQWICGISITIKFILDHSITSMLIEGIILLTSSIYVGMRSIITGTYSDEVEVHDQNNNISYSKRNIITSSVIGLTLALLIGVRSSTLYGETTYERWWFFFLVFFVSFLIYIPIMVGINVFLHHYAHKASQKTNNHDHRET
ncbi:DUF6773 family protein [Paenibacillus tundrae]